MRTMICKTRQVCVKDVGWKEWLFGSPEQYIDSETGGWLHFTTYYLRSGWLGFRYIQVEWEECEGDGDGWRKHIREECPEFEDFDSRLTQTGPKPTEKQAEDRHEQQALPNPVKEETNSKVGMSAEEVTEEQRLRRLDILADDYFMLTIQFPGDPRWKASCLSNTREGFDRLKQEAQTLHPEATVRIEGVTEDNIDLPRNCWWLHSKRSLEPPVQTEDDQGSHTDSLGFCTGDKLCGAEESHSQLRTPSCTRREGHTGDHQAWGGKHTGCIHAWPQEQTED